MKFGGCGGECNEEHGQYRCETGNKFATLSEEEREDDDDEGDEMMTGEREEGEIDEGQEAVAGLESTDDEEHGKWNNVVRKKMKRESKKERMEEDATATTFRTESGIRASRQVAPDNG